MEKPSHTNSLTRVAIVAALVLALGGAIFGVQRFRGGGADQAAQTAKNRGNFKGAPGFELKDASGNAHRLADLKGNVVILHFWAAWCPPCLEELSGFLKFTEQFQDGKLPVKFVAVSLDDSWTDAHRILPENAVPKGVLSLIDFAKETPDRYGTYQFPETYLIGPDLTIVTKWVGAQNWENPALRGIIERVANAK